ncbi:MFS transporter [Nocardia stercoris]|uniref:MFS transporter n=1 Tax=Nocardia stercoris TaxID=2483361 RepID=A0A3M2L0X8_9NOCA|nr:MFS transporter [Nocardia stercoris]RMI28198.1 MFS transporter [Nocardia stercoris]
MTETTDPLDTARNRRWTAIVAASAATVMTLDITVVNIALPRIGSDLHSGLDGLQWVVNAYTLTFAALLLIAGALSDRFGRRRIFTLGTVVFTVASAACMSAWSTELLIVGRAVQGIGGAMMMATALALIAGAYSGAEPGRRERAVAMFAAAGALAATAGPIVGGLIIDSMNWRVMFAVNIPLGAFILYGALRRVDDDRPGGGTIDGIGSVLAVLTLFAMNCALVEGPHKGWRQSDVDLALGGSAVLAVAFVVVMVRLGDRAMLPLRLLRIPSFSGAILLSFVARMVSFGMFPFLIIWLSASLRFSPIRVGLVLSVLAVALMVGAPIGMGLAKRMPIARVLAIGMLLTGIGMLTAVPIGPDAHWTALLPMLLSTGLGSGLVLPHLLDLAIAVVPPAEAGTASGAVNSFLPLGTSLSIAVYGAVFTAKVDSAMPGQALQRTGVPAEITAQVRDLATAGQLEAAARLAPGAAAPIHSLATSGYTHALSVIFLISGVGAVLSAFASLVLVRPEDKLAAVPQSARHPEPVRRQEL